MEKEYYGVVDIVKLICCIGITIVHCNNYGMAADGFGWYFLSFAVSIGVAFFFIASGYFLQRKIMANQENSWKIVKKYCIRLLWPLIFWDVINVVIEYINAVRNHISLADKTKEIVGEILFHPGGAMWYVQALIIAVLIWYVFIKYDKMIMGLCVGIVLYIIGSFGNTYFFVIENTALSSVVRVYMKIFNTTRNGIFVGVALVGLGLCVAKYNLRESKKKFVIAVATASIIMLIIEVVVAAGQNTLDNHSMYYSVLVLAPAIFILAAARTKNKIMYTVARKMSTGIYYSHVPMIVIVMFGYKIIGMNVNYGYKLWITDIVLCVGLCAFAMKINKKYVNRVMF